MNNHSAMTRCKNYLGDHKSCKKIKINSYFEEGKSKKLWGKKIRLNKLKRTCRGVILFFDIMKGKTPYWWEIRKGEKGCAGFIISWRHFWRTSLLRNQNKICTANFCNQTNLCCYRGEETNVCRRLIHKSQPYNKKFGL